MKMKEDKRRGRAPTTPCKSLLQGVAGDIPILIKAIRSFIRNMRTEKLLRKEVTNTKSMEEQINNIIPVLMEDIGSDGENESDLLLDYYLRCNTQEKVVVNKVMIYLCGWSFETLLKKCGIGIDEKGEPITVEDKTDE